MATKHKAGRARGLRLTLGGAPLSPQVVAGVPGLFRPDIPTPVGTADSPLTLEEAERLSEDPSVPLELVDIEDEQAARDQQAADLEAARSGIAAAARVAEGSEPARVEAEIAAVTATPAGAGQEG